MKIVLGLGNPGKKYQSNRHNIGFRCIDHLAEVHGIAIKKSSCQSDVGRMKIKGEDVLLVKPRTFVNLAGEAVACLLKKYRVSISDLIVIYDDLDLPTGRIRIRPVGSAGGHRGIKSIIQSIGDGNSGGSGLEYPGLLQTRSLKAKMLLWIMCWVIFLQMKRRSLVVLLIP